jgi:hypothetical protein
MIFYHEPWAWMLNHHPPMRVSNNLAQETAEYHLQARQSLKRLEAARAREEVQIDSDIAGVDAKPSCPEDL